MPAMNGTELPEKTGDIYAIESEYSNRTLTVNGAYIWEFSECETNCCGVIEFCNFSFFKIAQDKFNDACDYLFDRQRNDPYAEPYAYVQLTLTREHKKKKCHQAQLEAYLLQAEGAFCTPWRKNPNTKNEIQVWLIQV